jgi:hypothetical protein
MKHGAWTPCPKCRHIPKEPEDVAKHLMTTDHYFKRTDLEAIAARVQNGQPLTFDPKNVANIVASIKNHRPDDKRLKRFVAVYFTTIILLVFGVIAFAIYCVVRFFMK